MINNTTDSRNATIAFTLPICCQICLGKVKQPVVCRNQHVFCELCMKIWLERNKQCPACRVDINEEHPYKRVIGGFNNDNNEDQNDQFSRPEVRRARMELIVRDYEAEIQRLEDKVDFLQNENQCLKKRLSEKPIPTDSSTENSQQGQRKEDMDTILTLNNKLQDSHKESEKWKKELSKIKQKNILLRDENINLSRENERIRMEVSSRSPMKYGRYTVAALQTKVETYEKQVKQLKKALECSDAYVSQIQKELKTFKCKDTIDSPSFKRKRILEDVELVDVDFNVGNNAMRALEQCEFDTRSSATKKLFCENVKSSNSTITLTGSLGLSDELSTVPPLTPNKLNESSENSSSKPGCSNWLSDSAVQNGSMFHVNTASILHNKSAINQSHVLDRCSEINTNSNISIPGIRSLNSQESYYNVSEPYSPKSFGID